MSFSFSDFYDYAQEGILEVVCGAGVAASLAF
jgi:hypothetical protein